MLQEKLRNVYFERLLFPFFRLLRLILVKQCLVLIDFSQELIARKGWGELFFLNPFKKNRKHAHFFELP